jgi:hypothetical protein
MKIVEKLLTELKPYEKNPRNNANAIEPVAKSIKEFGFRVPIIIDKSNVIIAGHTRYLASQQLGLEKVPCIVANDLSPEKIKAFRLADNKVAEFAQWDFDLLADELEELTAFDFDFDMADFGFVEPDAIDWAEVEDLDKSNYEEPKKDMLQCPKCGHVDSKNHFRKIASDKDLEQIEVQDFTVKLAELSDIPAIKAIADKYSNEIGFVLRPALEENCKKGTLIVAKDRDTVLGFCNYNKRKDGVNVIYEICTEYCYRGNGIARKMIEAIERPIRLKCPIDNESNNFYANIGCQLVDVENGKKRKLNVWELA